MKYRTRKILSGLILVLWLPAYIVLAITVLGMFDRPPIWLELVIYAVLGILWALPFRRVFLGVGKPDPDRQGD